MARNVISNTFSGRGCYWLLFLVFGFLQGCATVSGGSSVTHAEEPPVNEALLIAAENYAGLIVLYKDQLEEAGSPIESDEIRLKLSHAYLQVGDPRSALFYIKPVITEGRNDPRFFLLKAKALRAQDKTSAALDAAQSALNLAPGNPEALNLAGLLHADRGDYKDARQYFNAARMHKYDDVTVINNLAVLDILEGDYHTAYNRLMPLYRLGTADEQVRANLAIALARANRYNEFRSIYNSTSSEEEKIALYRLITTLELEVDGA